MTSSSDIGSSPTQTPATVKGPAISTTVFGGILDYDGSGLYPGLELLNFVYGTEGDLLLPSDDEVRLSKRALDFGRKLVWDENFDSHPRRQEVLVGDDTEEVVRRLLECLQLPIPGSTKRPIWERAHFFPYTKSLVHWDARHKRNAAGSGHEVQFERRYLRGAGALAFRVLRKDPDVARLERCRKGFRALYPEGQGSPLEQLAAVLAANSAIERPKQDSVEPGCKVRDDELDQTYREGMARILGHTEISSVSRLRAVMNWTGFWLVLVQHARAAAFLTRPESRIVVDCGGSHVQLRRASQRCLKDLQATILDAVEAARVQMGASASLSKQQRNKIRGFFWATAATIKLLNAWRGRRHFTLGLDVLETLVLAATEPQSDLTFEQFVDDWLYSKCRLVVGRVAAEKAGLLASFDASIFEDNETHFARQMAAAGLLTEYSDATRMVGTGEHR